MSFMKRFGPANPSGTQLNKIYDTRGEITHGERLLYLDQSTSTSAFGQIQYLSVAMEKSPLMAISRSALVAS
jgi:hypothetical protein